MIAGLIERYVDEDEGGKEHIFPPLPDDLAPRVSGGHPADAAGRVE
jgi:hypothetical protein